MAYGNNAACPLPYLHELLPVALAHGRMVQVRHQWQGGQHGLQTLLKQPEQSDAVDKHC